MQNLRAGEEITVADRIRARRNQAYCTKLAVQAVEALNASTGGYGLHLSNPVQRAWRDANAVGRHVSLNWDAVGTMYGQHAFGLEPRGSIREFDPLSTVVTGLVPAIHVDPRDKPGDDDEEVTEGAGKWRKFSGSAAPIGRPCACRTSG